MNVIAAPMKMSWEFLGVLLELFILKRALPKAFSVTFSVSDNVKRKPTAWNWRTNILNQLASISVWKNIPLYCYGYGM